MNSEQTFGSESLVPDLEAPLKQGAERCRATNQGGKGEC